MVEKVSGFEVKMVSALLCCFPRDNKFDSTLFLSTQVYKCILEKKYGRSINLLHLMTEQSFEPEKINLSSGDTQRHVTDS